MKKTGLWLLSLVFVLGVVLAGCGGGSSGSSSQGGSGSTGSSGSGGSGGSGGSASKQTIKITIGAEQAADAKTEIRLLRDFFVPEVNKRLENTNYKIDWNEAYGGTIAKVGEALGALKSGLLDMSYVINAFEPANLKVNNIAFSVPFQSPDAVLATNVFAQLHQQHPAFVEEYERNGVMVLSTPTPTGSYELITTFPVNSLEDLKGRKVAAAGPNSPWIQAVGVVPVQSSLAEAYQSIQTGVYDGWVMYSSGVVGYKLYEVAKYYTLVGFGNSMQGALAVNKDVWSKLPQEVQDVIREVAAEYPLKVAEATNAENDTFIQTMKDNGVTVTELPQAEKEKWNQAVSNIPQDYANRLNNEGLPGSEIIQLYIDLLKQAGHQFPVEYKIN